MLMVGRHRPLLPDRPLLSATRTSRGDRQPEFTQLDLEMSFVDEEAVMAFVEAMVIEVRRATRPGAADPRGPFPRFTYDEAHGAVRLGQARRPVRDGARGPRRRRWRAGAGFRVFDEALAAGAA